MLDRFLLFLDDGAHEVTDRDHADHRAGVIHDGQVTDLAFLDTNRRCLARLQRPDLRGDVVERYTLLEAERTGKPVAGLDLGSTLVTVSCLSNVWLSVYVPENRLSKVRLGKPARVRIDGVAKAFDGVVSFVSEEAEFTPKNVQTPEERSKLVYRVKIALANPDGVFKPGMPADGYLDTR